MSEIKAKLNAALKEAMLGKDNIRRDVVRGLQAEMKQVEVDTRRELTNDDAITVLQREIKKRRESLDEASKVGRGDLVEKNQTELHIMEQFLPAQLSRDEVVALAKEAIATTGAASAKEMGKVMGALMPKVKGKADGGMVNQVVRELLNG